MPNTMPPDTMPPDTGRAANEAPRRPRCPFCGSDETELLSLFGSQLLTQQHYCRACHTPFEYIKDDTTDDAATPQSASR